MLEFHIEDVSNDEAEQHSADQPQKQDQIQKRAVSPVQIPNFGTSNWMDQFPVKQSKKKAVSRLLPGSFFSNYDQTFDDVFGEERIEVKPPEEVKTKKKKIVTITKEKSQPKTHSLPKDQSEDSKASKPARIKVPRKKKELPPKDPLILNEALLPKTFGDLKEPTRPIQPKKNVKKPKSREIKKSEIDKESELDKIILDKKYDPSVLELPKNDPIKGFKPGKKDLGVRQAYFGLTFDDDENQQFDLVENNQDGNNAVDQGQLRSHKKEKKKRKKESRNRHNEDHHIENAIDMQLKNQNHAKKKEKNQSQFSEQIASNEIQTYEDVVHKKKKKSKRSRKDANEVNHITLNTVSRLEDISNGEQASNNKRERRQTGSEKLIVGQYVAKPKKKVKIDEDETLDMDDLQLNPYIPDCVPNYYTDFDPSIKIIEHQGDTKQSAIYLIVQNGKQIKYTYKEMNLKYPNQIREYTESIEF